MVFALAQTINFLADTGLAQLNTHEDKQPAGAMHRGADEWGENRAWGRRFIVVESMRAVLRA